jgi:hypothetical protein
MMGRIAAFALVAAVLTTPLVAGETAGSPPQSAPAAAARDPLLPEGALAVVRAANYRKIMDGVRALADAGYVGTGAVAVTFADNSVSSVVPMAAADTSRPFALILMDTVKHKDNPLVMIVPVTGFARLQEALTAAHGAPAAKGEGFAEFEIVQEMAADDRKMRIQDAGSGYAVVTGGTAAGELAAITVKALAAAGGRLAPEGHDLHIHLDVARLAKLYEKEIAGGLDEARRAIRTDLERQAAASGPEVKCRERLQSLAFSCEVYADDNEGTYPDSPDKLKEEHLSTPGCTCCPASRSGYTLVTGLKTEDPADYLLAFETGQPHDGDKLRAVTLGAEVREFDADELRKKLAEQEEALRKGGRAMKTAAFPAAPAGKEAAPRTLEALGEELFPLFSKCLQNALDPAVDFTAAALNEVAAAELGVDISPQGLALTFGLRPAVGSQMEKIASGFKEAGPAAELAAALLPADRPVIVGAQGALPPALIELVCGICSRALEIMKPLIPEEEAGRTAIKALRTLLSGFRSSVRGQYARGEAAEMFVEILRCDDAKTVRGAYLAMFRAWNSTSLSRKLAACGLEVEVKENSGNRTNATTDTLRLRMEASGMFGNDDPATVRVANDAMRRAMEIQTGNPELRLELIQSGDLVIIGTGKDIEREIDAVLARQAAPVMTGGPLAGRLAAVPAGWYAAGDVYALELTRMIFARQLAQMRMLRDAARVVREEAGAAAEQGEEEGEEGEQEDNGEDGGGGENAVAAGQGGGDQENKVIEVGSGLPKVDDKRPVHFAVFNKGGVLSLKLEIETATVQEISAFGRQAVEVVMQEVFAGMGGGRQGLPPEEDEEFDDDELDDVLDEDEEEEVPDGVEELLAP